MELILKYFPELSEKQTEQFRQLDVLYHDCHFQERHRQSV